MSLLKTISIFDQIESQACGLAFWGYISRNNSLVLLVFLLELQSGKEVLYARKRMVAYENGMTT